MSISCPQEELTYEEQVPIVRFRADSLTIEPQERIQGLSPLQDYYKKTSSLKGSKPTIRRLDTMSSNMSDSSTAAIIPRSRVHSFANATYIKIISAIVIVIILLANTYAIIQAAQGKT